MSGKARADFDAEEARRHVPRLRVLRPMLTDDEMTALRVIAAEGDMTLTQLATTIISRAINEDKARRSSGG